MRQRDGLEVSDGPSNTFEPVVSSGTRHAGKCGHEIGSGEIRKVIVEGHARRIPGKEKSAMRKIELAESPQCGQITPVNATLKQHGIESTNEVTIRYAGRRQAQNNWEGWIVEAEGMTIASGFNTEAKAKQWAKRREMKIIP